MARIDYSFSAQVNYSGGYRAIAYSVSDGLPVSQQDFVAPHPATIIGQLNTPNNEAHRIDILAMGCGNKVVGSIVVSPPVASCSVPVGVSFTSSGNQASLTWSNPAYPPSNGFDYKLYRVGSSDLLVYSGNTLSNVVSFPNLETAATYRAELNSNCGSSKSAVVSKTITTAGTLPVIFRNKLTSGEIVVISIDSGANILPDPIAVNENFYYTSITSGIHSISADLSDDNNGKNIQVSQIRNGEEYNSSIIYYTSGVIELGTAIEFELGDIFEISNV